MGSVSRLKVVGLHHDFDFKDHHKKFSTPFKPLPPKTPLEVNEVYITPTIEKLTQNYDTFLDLPNEQTDEAKLSLENASPTDSPHLEQNLMSLQELTPDKVMKLQKNDTFCKNIPQHIHCSKNDNSFIDTLCILHKKVINFNSTFSAVVLPQILIKYLLHASHDLP